MQSNISLRHTGQRGGSIVGASISLLIIACLLILSGCAATTLAISKRHLDVQTKMTATIFLDPVSPDKRVAFIQIRNTSDKPDFDIEGQVAGAIMAKGYRLTQDPDEAYYLVQVNVLQVGKIDPTAADKSFLGGYGGALDGYMLAGTASSVLGGSNRTNVGLGLLGGLLGTIANAAVKDVTYAITTDIQISERAREGVVVNENNLSELAQGTSGSKLVTSNETTKWKRYQTRIMSTANKVNLKFEAAAPFLVEGLIRSISGIL